MGVNGLLTFLKNYVPNAFQTRFGTESYKGKVVVFDASEIIHRFYRAMSSCDNKLVDKRGRPTIHLYAIMNVLSSHLSNSILPVIVFDGVPPSIKQKTIDARNNSAINAEKRALNATDKKEIIKAKKRAFRIKPYMIKDCKQFLSLLGVPFVSSPEEADSQCAVLGKYVDSIYGVAVEDNDSLPFGSPIVLKNFKKSSVVTEISLDKVVKGLKITFSEFVDVCVLASTDYSSNMKNVGVATAYNTLLWVKKNGVILDNNLPYLNTLKDGLTVKFMSDVYPNMTFSDKCDEKEKSEWMSLLKSDERFKMTFLIVQKLHNRNKTKQSDIWRGTHYNFFREYILAKLYYTERAKVEDPDCVAKRLDLTNSLEFVKNIDHFVIEEFLFERGFFKDNVERFIRGLKNVKLKLEQKDTKKI